MMGCGLVADRGCLSCYADVLREKDRMITMQSDSYERGEVSMGVLIQFNCWSCDSVLMGMREACGAQIESEHKERSTGICVELFRGRKANTGNKATRIIGIRIRIYTANKNR